MSICSFGRLAAMASTALPPKAKAPVPQRVEELDTLHKRQQPRTAIA